MKTVAIIQARTGSTRLPGKVMKTLSGKTVLGHVISRVKACPLVDEVVVATTAAAKDNVIVTESAKHGAMYFRGSEDNVLERYYLAAKQFNADIIVRITSDCPLFDPQLLSKMLGYFHKNNTPEKHIDYLSNTLSRSFPRGLDAEIFTFDALQLATQEASQPFEMEHVTPYLYQHPEKFSLAEYRNETDLSHYRWTLDTEEDYSLLAAIFATLDDGNNSIFPTEAVLSFLKKRPELVALNAHIEQKKLGE
jgi:spore coat polysaccharide biosynthesis protein SpsF